MPIINIRKLPDKIEKVFFLSLFKCAALTCWLDLADDVLLSLYAMFDS